MARYRHNSLCTDYSRTEDDGYDDGSAGEESALHESRECGRNCCDNPNSDDDENEFHDRKLCGPACCGTPSQDDADALIVLDAAVATAKVAPGTVGGAVFTDVYLEQLLISYKKRHAQFCRHRRYYSDRMLVPYLVWKKVHVEFLERFPETNFDPLLLKTHLRRALFASNPPNYYCMSSERKYYAQSASASTATVASASAVFHASASKVPVVQATASANAAATRVVKTDGAVSRTVPPSLATRPASTSNAAEESSTRKRSSAKAAHTRSVAARALLVYRAVPVSCGARSAKAAAPAAPIFAQKRASVNAKSTARATATQVPAPVNGLPRHTTVTLRASHFVATAGDTSTRAPVMHPPVVLDTEPNPGSSSSVNGVVPTSCTPAQANGPVIKREQTISASTSVESSASVVGQQQQQQQMDVESGSLRDDSDHSITEESNSDESIAEDSSPHQQQGSQRDRRQKRRLRASQMELLELKKQKVALENLKLAVELGIITQQECIARGRRRIPRRTKEKAHTVMSRYRRSFSCTYCGETEDDNWAISNRSEGYQSDGESGDDENAYHENGECGKSCCGEPNSSDDEAEYHNRKFCGPTCHGVPSQADANARALLDAATTAGRVVLGTVDDAVFTDVYLKFLLLSFKRRYAQFCRRRPHYREGQLVPSLVWKKIYADFKATFPGTNFDSLLLKTHLRRALYASEPPCYEPPDPSREYYNQPGQGARKKKTAKQRAAARQKFWWTRDRYKACTYCGETEDDNWAISNRSDDYQSDGESGDDENAYHENGECGKSCCGEPNSSDDEAEYHNRKFCGPTCHGVPSQADANARALLDAATTAGRVAPGTVDNVAFNDVYLQHLLVSFKRRYAQFCRRRPHYRENQLVPSLVWKKVLEDFQSKFPGTNFDSLLLKTHLRRALYASDPPNYYSSSERDYYEQPDPAPAPAPVAPMVLPAPVSAPAVVCPPRTVAQAIALSNARPTRFVPAMPPFVPPALSAHQAQAAAVAAAVAQMSAAVATSLSGRAAALQAPAPVNVMPAFTSALMPFAVHPAAAMPFAAHPVVTMPLATYPVAAAALAPMQASAVPDANLNSETAGPANGGATSSNGNHTQTNPPAIKNEQIVPGIPPTMETSVATFVEQVDLGSEFPLHGDGDHSATDTASSDTEKEVNEDDDSNPQSQLQEESQKRRRLDNAVELQELKKRKLALENLKLARDLGIITREECIEKARQVVQE